MALREYPSFFADRMFSNDDALDQVVKSGYTLGSGFATSEPHTFYSTLWDHVQKRDLTDLNIRQALFMAPHPLLVNGALKSRGLLADTVATRDENDLFMGLARKVNMTTKKLEGLKKLIGHYEELKERRIVFRSAFIGAATNGIIPSNIITNTLYPDYVLRNTSRMGITDMQSIHFPDAVDSMGYDPDNRPVVSTFVTMFTPPDENGDMSLGVANGANGEIIEKILNNCDVNLLVYLNPKYPFTRGFADAPHTFNLKQFEALARSGRLFVVEDDAEVPALPPDSFKNPEPAELKIAENVVNHIEQNRQVTCGRAIQVGFGGTGVLAIRALKDSSWNGRIYTEMLEPFTMDLFEAGKISGSHFIEKDGRRVMLDGKMVCTFTIAERNSDFYKRLHNNPAVVVGPASRVVIPEGFYYGMGINNCLAIDFQGHVNSGGRDQNHHSGVGGGAQIMRGLSRGGIGYLCLKSSHRGLDGKLHSSIFSFMPRGTPISHIGPDLMGGRDGARFFLVTEHGVARLSGQSQSELIKNLISVADPRFREELKHEAWKEFRVRV